MSDTKASSGPALTEIYRAIAEHPETKMEDERRKKWREYLAGLSLDELRKLAASDDWESRFDEVAPNE